jgi:hypothetical protein
MLKSLVNKAKNFTHTALSNKSPNNASDSSTSSNRSRDVNGNNDALEELESEVGELLSAWNEYSKTAKLHLKAWNHLNDRMVHFGQ